MIRSHLLLVNPFNHPSKQYVVVSMAVQWQGQQCGLMVEFGTVFSAVGCQAIEQDFMKGCEWGKFGKLETEILIPTQGGKNFFCFHLP